ncbi:MAG: tail fiber protein [Balneolaceae bacterium]|nr:tail fiber protein [Balneolaceae bacterium]
MEEYMGMIKIFAGDFAPKNWAFCHGQLLSIQEETALFSLIGTRYGGDGRTTFGLPDLRGAVPVGAGQADQTHYRLGQRGGSERVQLTQLEMPAHTHSGQGAIRASGGEATSNNPENRYPAVGRTQIERNKYKDTLTYASEADTDMAGDAVMFTTNSTGGNNAHENMPPYLTVNYIICVRGLYPPRPSDNQND